MQSPYGTDLSHPKMQERFGFSNKGQNLCTLMYKYADKIIHVHAPNSARTNLFCVFASYRISFASILSVSLLIGIKLFFLFAPLRSN
jgi:hypothetical protein